MTLEKMDREVRKMMDEKRYIHTVGVRYTAASLAMAHGSDMESAEIAGLLHDSAKQLPDSEKLKLCKKYGIEISECERKNLFLLHAKLGAYFASDRFGITDENIISAIRWHTTGRAGMTPLEQIIFIADYIEPGRSKASNLPKIRKEAFRDLDECCYMILQNMLDYLEGTGGEIDMTTKTAFDYYLEMHEERHEKGGPESDD